MFEALKLRTLVIGNSGSGKSRLAEGLSALIHAPIFDLDLIHWKDNGYGAKQDEDVARQKVANLAATERWVIEGVYGWLAEVAVPRAYGTWLKTAVSNLQRSYQPYDFRRRQAVLDRMGEYRAVRDSGKERASPALIHDWRNAWEVDG